MTDPNYNSVEAQRKLAAIYNGPFLDLVCRSESVSLRDLLDQPPIVASSSSSSSGNSNNNAGGGGALGAISSSSDNKQGGNDDNSNNDAATLKQILEMDQPPRLLPALPQNISTALRTEVLAILRGH